MNTNIHDMQTELILLILSVLFFVSILAGKAGSRFGVPALLLFLGVGMLFGSDGLGWVHFNNIKVAQAIGTVALSAILFSGGLDTKFADIKPVLGPGIMLATAGVLLTALCTGLVLYAIANRHLELGLMPCLLLAATMSSTDSASVFSILRGRGLNLKHNLRPTLELESGSNDPMAYVLVITLTTIVLQGGQPHWGAALAMLVVQLVVGALAGFLLGKGMVWLVNRINIDNAALYPILVLSGSFFVFAATYFVKGNSYLAVYIAGLIVGNSKFVHKRSTRNFFEGISWLMQLSMFLTLGLLVNPSELRQVLVPGLVISFVMIFAARPLGVFASLAPFRKFTLRDRLFVSWVGLRGAVPIIFAILCRANGVPHSEVMFNIVFLCTLVSLVVQGTTLPLMARWLGVAEQPKADLLGQSTDFDIDFPEEIKSASAEVEVTGPMLAKGTLLMDLGMPEKTLVIMVKRGDSYFVPTGKTSLHPGDRLMVLSDNEEALAETLLRLGVKPHDPHEKKEKTPWTSVFFDDEK
ncbi:MAG: potassium/proton antiporter [Bacteroidales bacterium]|nr:potassium/proton antiporter [Bacteroidales bacterium]